MVAMPGLDNPAKASAGVRILLTINKLRAPNNIVSAGKRLLASSNREQVNISVTAKRSICIKIKASLKLMVKQNGAYIFNNISIFALKLDAQ
jgi:hypothetical protein